MPAVNSKNNRWLARRYGSRRGFVRTYWHKARYYLGAYRQYEDIDWQSIDRLVFVCKGNICRSAFAEVMTQSLGVEAISCGLDTIENARANQDAIYVAERFGVDLKKHRTLPVMYVNLKHSDLLIAMEPWQINFLKDNLKRKHQSTLLGLWTSPVLPHLQDPYGASHAYFESCFHSIQMCVENLSEKIKK